ncbi:hypothetical protein ASF48_03825 [Rathayibacter sp. Leaf299]|uniref:hypothetical protein n=1 Tax=unclassified Rathayibacter TaxID=2609250 RepID=UPI0006FBBEFB|nr:MULTISPECIES: hypothetical protein [unclassified Rathayibacter]KQQ22340.1 hypothetical protein ASF48_03825 [Rathayibacter sp. Leaf299]
MQTRWARVARGVTAAVAATAVAAASHTLAGATAPTPAVLALAGAFAAVVCVFLAGRRLSLLRLSLSVLLSQLAFHVLFLASGGGDVSVVGTTATGAHFHDGGTVELVAAGGGHAAHSPLMTLAHLVAGVLTIAALRRGETLFWTLGEQLARVVVRFVVRAGALLLGPVGPSVAVHGAPEPRSPHPLDAALTHLRHRGPPLRVLHAA